MKNILFLSFLLLAPLGVSLLINRLNKQQVVTLRFAARLGLSLVLFTTGIAHFVQTDGMARLLPPWVPMVRELILITGGLEVAAAIGVLIERTAPLTARCLIVFFIAVFPANVWAAFNHVDYGGHSLGPAYLLARGPLQVLLLFWSWRISGRRPDNQGF